MESTANIRCRNKLRSSASGSLTAEEGRDTIETGKCWDGVGVGSRCGTGIPETDFGPAVIEASTS